MINKNDSSGILAGNLETLSLPAKLLATCIILTMTVGMMGAMSQIIIHDIIPTFFNEKMSPDTPASTRDNASEHQTKSALHTDRGGICFPIYRPLQPHRSTSLFTCTINLSGRLNGPIFIFSE